GAAPRPSRLLRRAAPRQRHAEQGAAAVSLALGGDGPAVALYHVFRNREPQPEPSRTTFPACVALAEAVEDVQQQLRSDAFPGVPDLEADIRRFGQQGDAYDAALGGELERVREQVRDHLAEQVLVPVHD